MIHEYHGCWRRSPPLYLDCYQPSHTHFHFHQHKMISFVAVAAVLLTRTDSSSALSVPHRFHHRLASTKSSSHVICQYANSPFDDDRPQDVIKQRRIPRRAMPHIQTASRAEEATRAGYIIRRDHSVEVADRSSDGNGRRVRPLRIIRRIVLRRGRRDEMNPTDTIQTEQRRTLEDLEFLDDELTEEVTIELSYQSNRKPKLRNASALQSSLLKNAKYSSPSASKPNISNRVTFKSTRGASRSIPSFCPTASAGATLTEYMTQPVEQYSLLSFHDEEPVNKNKGSSSKGSSANSLKARRWLVRRLTSEESERYIDQSDGRGSKLINPASIDNLFRLAVPLQPLIGWDLTPVIDLEVIPPQVNLNTSKIEARFNRGQEPAMMSCNRNNCNHGEVASVDLNRKQHKWAPLKGIRSRVGGNSDYVGTDNEQLIPIVKIRSLSVSLLSTQDEVHAAMLEKQPISNKLQYHQTSKMQEEAIGMVGKVEEWLKPHITFEAELSWTDNRGVGANKDNINPTTPDSTVTVKSTAITSLTIPKLPSGILHAAVPSAFLVKRLGSTLTSKALEICLPRFLRHLERDYYRWSGLDGVSAKNES